MKKDYDTKSIKELLETVLSKKKCMKHPIAVVIETIDGRYIRGWNGPPTRGREHSECLRKGYPSGEGLELCPSVHAEKRAIGYAARKGVKLESGIIYLNEWFPCADCAKSIIESGLSKLVTPDELYLDKGNHILVEKLQNKSYNFEMAEKLIREAEIEIIIDPLIRV